MDRKLARTRELRRLHRSMGSDPRAIDRVAFPCASGCLACGWLELPAEPGDPMRRAQQAELPPHPCPKCGARSWLDLADEATMRAWTELERRELEGRPSRLGASVMTALGLGLVAIVSIGGVPLFEAFPVLAIAGTCAAFGAHRLREAMAPRRRRRYRWRTPALRSEATDRIAQGPIEGGESTVAPVTGRPCIAWRVEVRRVGDPDGRVALLEQSCRATRVGGTPLATEPTLALAVAPVCAESTEACTYLRSRGIDPHDAIEVSEAILVPRDVVVLFADGRGGPPVVERA
jgi:hypothetical protein